MEGTVHSQFSLQAAVARPADKGVIQLDLWLEARRQLFILLLDCQFLLRRLQMLGLGILLLVVLPALLLLKVFYFLLLAVEAVVKLLGP
jgi:hypothetical protein